MLTGLFVTLYEVICIYFISYIDYRLNDVNNFVQSKLFITSLIITEYSIGDIKLLGTDLFPL